jgi:SAM-dependent methyltransferase
MRVATVLYAVAIFLSSCLLFLVEPMAGKRLLPLLGGSAAVWTACLVFFQCALLLGYLVAHGLITRASARAQGIVYIALLAASIVQLSRAISPDLRASPSHPIASVLWLLTVLIGLPFVSLSATSPLLQAWYSRWVVHRPAGTDASALATSPQPYRLFAISNVGSMSALVVYPWLIEPRSSLRVQAVGVVVGFTLLAALCAVIAYSIRDVPALASATRGSADAIPEPSSENVARDRIMWVLLAACGSLLLSAVTNHLSQNVATIPLLWVIPLVAYLLSFVVAFSGGRWHPRWLVITLFVGAMGVAGYYLHKGDLEVSRTVLISAFSIALFLQCLFFHSEVYRRRPAPRHLTAFYFYVAAGGAVGAMLVGVAAPSVLSGNYELAIGLVLAALLALAATWASGWIARGFWTAGAAVMLALLVLEVRQDRENSLLRVRNFYGTLHVTQVSDARYNAVVRTLYNGVIEHGQQVFNTTLGTTPTTYYGHPSGVGIALDLCCGTAPRRVGVIGLGTGTLAAYGKPGDVFRFYDLNPAVERIARNVFAYLRNSQAKIEIVMGDARLSLAAEPPQHYDVLVIDAFSGDAIPVHLMTTQAIDLYRRHLQPNGIIAFHVSNRFLDLAPVVEQLAQHAGLETTFISSDDDTPLDLDSADWVLVTANKEFLEQARSEGSPQAITVPRGLHVWTDDYNSLLPVLRRSATKSE